MTAIVSSMVRLLGAIIGAVAGLFSNGCATSPSVSFRRQLIVVVHTVGAILLTVEVALAQEPVTQPNTAATHSGQAAASAGFPRRHVALAAHERAPAVRRHLRRAPSSASRFIPSRSRTIKAFAPPGVRDRSAGLGPGGDERADPDAASRAAAERAVRGGLFAFNVLASVGYAGAAFARTGPPERDTRGMADSLRWKEPAIGVLILIPALLDAFRYYHPDAKWAAWGSRAAKVVGVVLVAR